jgi:putative GTP pyrophosphokinase
MAREVTKTQIDRLGERLKKGNVSGADLQLLDHYRRSFSGAYEMVIATVREKLVQEPAGRPAKSTMSIIDKLRRESIRLSQMQDIAGCRLLPPNVVYQERDVQDLKRVFEHVTVVDRRAHPSHGYRAVHVIVKHLDRMVEIQVRTILQHVWAQLSEKASDMIDPTIKYGGGEAATQKLLADYSSSIADVEAFELRSASLQRRWASSEALTDHKIQQMITALQEAVDKLRYELWRKLHEAIKQVEQSRTLQ